ncbi:MAG TPA: MBL fold metallo-hydrolase [Isosphaeraceae bacterium]|jgi:glyoxylase-like metal-dependent hydrolase (beta-lactamase superfamily II)
MMRRRDVLKAGVGAVVLGAGRARADDPVAESDPADAIKKAGAMFAVPVKIEALNDKLHVIAGPGGNIAALAGPDGLVLVDDGLPGRVKDVQAAAKSLCDRPVSTIINTHWHFDHTGGNAAFGRDGARIWATANARKRLATDQYNEAFKMKSPASPPEALPVVSFDEAEVYVGDESLHMIAVPPAHTDGDLVIHFRKADVIHAGDLFSNGFYPNIDDSSRGWIGGMVDAAGRILKMAGPGTRIIPGHGPVATVDDLRAFRKMLVTLYDRLGPLADARTPVDDVIRARPTADLDPTWAKGLFNGPTYTRIVYDGLLKHRADSGR